MVIFHSYVSLPEGSLPEATTLVPLGHAAGKTKTVFLQRSGDAAGGGGESDPKELLGFFSARFFWPLVN